MMPSRRRFVLGITSAVALILALGQFPALARKEPVEKYQANAFAQTGPGTTQATTLNINIYEWSDDDDREMVVDAIEEATGNRRAYRAVPDALRKLGKAGYMFLAGRRGWPIRYAREFEVDGKREILLVTDRPVTFTEVYSGSAVRDFDITVILLRFEGGSETGEGIVSVGTEIVWDDTTDQLEITNVSSQPVELGDVRPVE